jgi:hypothetical protein
MAALAAFRLRGSLYLDRLSGPLRIAASLSLGWIRFRSGFLSAQDSRVDSG